MAAIERGTLVGYRVKVTDENGLKVLKREDYLLADWPAAKRHAANEYDRLCRLFLHDIVELIELRATCVVVECGVLKTSAE